VVLLEHQQGVSSTVPTTLVIVDAVVSDPVDAHANERALIIPGLTRLVRAARDASIPIIWIDNTYDSPWLVDRPSDGGGGHQLGADLQPKPGDFVIRKRFSAAMEHSPFDLALRCRGVRNVVLAGGPVLGGFEAAVKACYVWGYIAIAVKDCVYPTSGPFYEEGLAYLQKRLGEVSTSDAVMRAWSSASNSPAGV